MHALFRAAKHAAASACTSVNRGSPNAVAVEPPKNSFDTSTTLLSISHMSMT